MDFKKGSSDGLDDEMRAKLVACDSPEELIALSQSSGVELTDGMLDGISGGGYGSDNSDCEWYNEYACNDDL